MQNVPKRPATRRPPSLAASHVLRRLVVCLLCARSLDTPGLGATPATPSTLAETPRALPVVATVDVVVVGGSSAAVAAATAARRAGATVFLAAPRTYLGEDLCGTLRLWLEPDEEPRDPLAIQLFAETAATPPTHGEDHGAAPASRPAQRQPPTPLHVKRTLDQALLTAGVDFVFGSYPSDILWDRAGRPCGVVFANRAGRQAVLAKGIIDATDAATVALLAGARFDRSPTDATIVRRTVIGAPPEPASWVSVRPLPFHVVEAQARHPVYECALRLPVQDPGWRASAEAEQQARDATWNRGLVVAAETLFRIPEQMLVARTPPPAGWPGVERLPIDVCRPAGLDGVYVLGGCVGVARQDAELLLRPLAQLTLGARVGEAAAAEALTRSEPIGPALPGTDAVSTEKGTTAEALAGLRGTASLGASVPAGRRLLPVVARFDVVVVGGGTGGAPAALGAARQGAKTLVLEYLHELGGVSTAGLIGKYYHGNRVGVTKEIDAGVARLEATVGVLGKAEYYRRALRGEGVELWFGVLAVGAWVEEGKVRGVVVATPQGRFAVGAGVVVDATGNADIAAAAGAETTFVSGEHVAMQGTGLPTLRLGASYTNTDYTFVDDADMLDLWRLFVGSRQRARKAFDIGQLPDTRERRRIVGEVVVSPLDILNHWTWPDTICIAKSDFDSHGYTVHPVFLLQPPNRDGKSLSAHLPYRALIPRGLDGLLVIGLGLSAHRDAMPILRMQPDIQNHGYAAGVAAAMAARQTKGAVREIDVRRLQAHLVAVGNLPSEVAEQGDSYPLPRATLVDAVSHLPSGGHAAMAVLLANPADATPLLREAYAAADREADRLAYAHILGMLGDATGAATLMATVRASAWDKGWNFRGMGQYGASLSPLDSQLIALGRSGDRKALPVLLEKATALTPSDAFSHFRAVAMALESLRDPAAAAPLAALLRLPGVAGHTLTSADTTENRSATLRELVLARALYRCGDIEGLGEGTLRAYAADLRGVFSRHARAVLTPVP